MCSRKYFQGIAVLAGLVASSISLAQDWTRPFVTEPTPAEANPILRWISSYETARVDYTELRSLLADAPKEILGLADQAGVEMLLPLPDGRLIRFNVWENNVLGPQVQRQIPDFKLYSGQGIDDPTYSVRFEVGYGRLSAMISTPEGAYFIEPMRRKPDGTYFLYARRDSLRGPGWTCRVVDEKGNDIVDTPGFLKPAPEEVEPDLRITGTNLWTFRTAVNATAEYVTFWGGNTVTATSQIGTSVNRVDGVYRKEAAIRLNLTWTQVFTNAATDPYDNNNGGTMLGQNQARMDAAGTPGSANYDLGHVFSTGGGGIAGLGVVGITGQKARGVTGSGSPTGDTFDIDYVAHEMGHQFAGNHSFNGITGSCAGNRNAATAWEPGSGSTIMSYAGICGSEDVQPNSHDYLHIGSIQEFLTVRTAARGGVATASGNGVPTVNAGLDYAIPISTPFKLTMTATDPNGHALTHQWDQQNVGTSGATTLTTTNTSRPLFRSFLPTVSPTRFFPSQALALANNFTNQFEFLPNVARTMRMRAVARDNQTAGGGVNVDDMTITVSGTTPFAVTAPNTAVSWNRNRFFNVTWDPAGTTGTAFAVSTVKIWLSTNGGASFYSGTATQLTASTANDGAELISMPLSTAASSTARIIIEANNNIFFDHSNVNFSIATANTLPTGPVISNQTITEQSLWTLSAAGSDADDAQTITYSLVSPPTGMTINSTTGLISWTPDEAQGPGTYPVTARITDNNFGTPGVFNRTFNVTVNEDAPRTVAGTVNFLEWIPSEVGAGVTVRIQALAGGTILQTDTPNLGAGNAFAVTTALPDATYNVLVSKPFFLTRKIPNVVVNSVGGVAGNFDLIPGDVDNSNEIDAADIDLVIAAFGGSAVGADVDGSGEVDAADIDIVISYFGSTGDI